MKRVFYILLLAFVSCAAPEHIVSTHFESNPLEGVVCADNQILYVTLDAQPVNIRESADFAQMVKSHCYGDYGVIELTAPLTQIGSVPFAKNRQLAAVTLPQSVVKIDYGAFTGCQALQYINIPDEVTEIGANAFCDCHSLKSVIIPNSVTRIKDCAFEDCWSLEHTMIGTSVCLIGERAFGGCTGRLTINCNIPTSNVVTEYGSEGPAITGYVGVFERSKFSEVIVGEGVTTIGSRAFMFNTNLERVVLPTTLRKISRYAFYGCDNLRTIECNAVLPPKLKLCAIPKNEQLVKTCVPSGSVELYRDVWRWNRRTIIEAQ